MMNNAGCSYRRKVTKRMAMRSSKKIETGAEEYGFSNVCCGHARWGEAARAGVFLPRKGLRQIAFADVVGAFDENGLGRRRWHFFIVKAGCTFSSEYPFWNLQIQGIVDIWIQKSEYDIKVWETNFWEWIERQIDKFPDAKQQATIVSRLTGYYTFWIFLFRPLQFIHDFRRYLPHPVFAAAPPGTTHHFGIMWYISIACFSTSG